MQFHKTLLIVFLSIFAISCSSTSYRTENIKEVDEATEVKIKKIYQESDFQQTISLDLFRMAMIGFYHIDNLKKSDKIIIIDYSKPSTEKRFFVIDLEKKKLLYDCLVAHGKNSGENLASKFSNVSGSKQTSLGFFITAETYQGKNGFSLRLDGIEKDINHKARKRAIVIHAADYVSEEFIKENGRLGRSWGCPALPNNLSEEIINSIAAGRCLFIFGDDPEYLKKSKYVPEDLKKLTKN